MDIGSPDVKSRFEPLDPIERSQEVLFGLIMVLTFTATLSVVDGGNTEIKVMIIGIVGCNFAWGVVDAVMHLMATFAERARDLVERPGVAPRPRLFRDDFLRASGVFLLVFVCTAPAVIPFLVVHDVRVAVRIAHGLVIAMMFSAGWSLGAHAGRPPWRTGLVMAVVGIALAALTIALGG